MCKISPIPGQCSFDFANDTQAHSSAPTSTQSSEKTNETPRQTDTETRDEHSSAVGVAASISAPIQNTPAPSRSCERHGAAKTRNVAPQPITCLEDILDATETLFHAKLDLLKSDATPNTTIAGLGRLASVTGKDKRNLRNARKRMICKGILEVWGDGDCRGRGTVYHLFSPEEIISSLTELGYTHWVRCGRGKKLLKLGFENGIEISPESGMGPA